jgi:DNA topoisomerase III
VKPLDLAGVRVGAFVRAVSARVVVTQSEPPQRYTEADLLEDMLQAERHAVSVADAAVLRATNGIGTARTRSEGIVDLLRNDSLARLSTSINGVRRTEVVLTEAGSRLEGALPAELKSVGLTAKWEMLCRQIERGELNPEHFRVVIRKFVTAVVADVRRRKNLRTGATTSQKSGQNEQSVEPNKS